MHTVHMETFSGETQIGEIIVEGPVMATNLEKMFLHAGLNRFRPAAKQMEALVKIAALPEGMIYAASIGQMIIGYLTFHAPSKYSRWSKHPGVLELGGIEVSPLWRHKGFGTALLQTANLNPVLGQYIVVALEFCWHWDLAGTGLSLPAYRKMMIKTFEKAGLHIQPTDDPDILEDPANLMAVRIGYQVSREHVALFKAMLFEKPQAQQLH